MIVSKNTTDPNIQHGSPTDPNPHRSVVWNCLDELCCFFYACLYNEWSAVGVACGWLKQHRQGHGLPTTWWLWGAWILLEWSELIHWLNVILGLAYNQFKEMHASPLCIYTVDSVGLARSWEGIHCWKCCPQSERQKMCDWCHAPECLL